MDRLRNLSTYPQTGLLAPGRQCRQCRQLLPLGFLVQLGQRPGAQMPAAHLPLVLSLGRDRARQPDHGCLAVEDAHHVGTALDLLIELFRGVLLQICRQRPLGKEM